MSKRTTKHTVEERLAIITAVLEGRDSAHHLSVVHSLSPHTISEWIRRFQSSGIEGLQESRTRAVYPAELKKEAVLEHLAGQASYADICRKYHISSTSVLRRWINQYTGGEEEKNTRKGMIPMTPGRKTTLEERIEIVQYTLSHELDYQAAMTRYGISYQQVYSWVRKYRAHGEAGLVDRRGKKMSEETVLTEEERLRLRIKELEHRNQYLEAKEALAKKLSELERRGMNIDQED